MSAAGSLPSLLARIATVLFGAVPATYLCLWAYVFMMLGFLTLLSGRIVGVYFVASGLAGFYGTLSLWGIAFGVVRRWSVLGLVVGTLAVLPFAVPVLSYWMFGTLVAGFHGLLFIGPLLVAITWLCALGVARLCCRDSVPSAQSRVRGG